MHNVAATLTQLCFDDLDAPPVVIGSRNWITPAAELEAMFFPSPVGSSTPFTRGSFRCPVTSPDDPDARRTDPARKTGGVNQSGLTASVFFTLPVKGDISPGPFSLEPVGGLIETGGGTLSTKSAAMIRRILATLFLALLVASPALAQTGQINGVITDNTGAVVPGANVKAVETATGLSRDTVTGADGRYTFTSLRPTTYDVTAELSGFRTSQRKGLLLEASQNVTVNLSLELGALAETVTVTGESPTVDVTSSTLSEVVDGKRIVELPLNGRDAAKLALGVAGMVLTLVDQESGKTIPGALRLSTNGTESRQVSFRLDGTSHTDPYFQQNQPFPFPDALQEFSIQTSNYSAVQGNSAGAVVNAVTRSGTNDFHGGGFGYLRDRTFNARNFFSPEKDFLKRKQYGGFAGGPIQRNKTFFFVGWQGTRLENVGTTKTATVPTAEQRAGNFGSTTVRDPLTGQPFPNNQIPVARFDPASVNVLKYMPLPGADGRILIPRRIGQQDDQMVIKADRTLGPKDQLSVRYFFDDFHNDPTYTEGNLLSYSNPTLAAGTRMQNIVGGWTRTISNTLLNETRIGYNHTFSRRFPPPGVPSMQELGVRLPIYPALPSISEINANNFFNIGDNLEASFYRPGLEINNRVSWVKGKHALQFGGELQHYVVEIRNQFRRAGHFQFAGSTTTGTGNTLADFLLGSLSSFEQGTGEYKDYVVNYGSLFVHDDYRVSSRLTLNLGVRYESTPPWHEKVGRIEYFSLDTYQNNVHSTLFPQAPRGELFRGDPGIPGEDGTDPSTAQLGSSRRLRVGRHGRRQDEPPRRRRRVLRSASRRRIGERRRQRGAVEPPPGRHTAGGPALQSVSRTDRLQPHY
jgi:hypothetical protein